MRLLQVEDDPMLEDAVQRVLQQESFAVDWSRDGEEAELALGSIPYDLMLLDLGLPGKTGLDILHDLRKRKDSIPVIILTARDAVSDRIAGLDCGADDYLVKPFDPDELAARIRALLGYSGDIRIFSRGYSGDIIPIIVSSERIFRGHNTDYCFFRIFREDIQEDIQGT